MVKASRSGSQKAGSNDTQAQSNKQPSTNTQAKNGVQAQETSQPSTTATSHASTATSHRKGKQSSKSSQARIGGTAVAGAKSTQQKETSTGSPSNQQPEYYNRDTRRRMEHMGTGPYAERAVVDPRERRKKRKERLEERQERIKHLVNAKGPSRDVKLGRRNTYFLIGIVLALIILVVAFIVIRHPF
jgi:tetrahydromethanopterin S-methyltransferase subunit G